jgi:hypothetical protein
MNLFVLVVVLKREEGKRQIKRKNKLKFTWHLRRCFVKEIGLCEAEFGQYYAVDAGIN